jgi:basic membrane protein A
MKSKWLILFMVFSLFLVACGGGSDEAAVEEVVEEEPAETLDSPATTAAPAEPVEDPKSICLVLDIGGLGDLSFNDLAYSGYQKAIEDFGMVGTFLEPDGGGENRGELLELCAEAGNDLIVGNGFLFDASMNEVAPNYPEINFAITDGVAEPSNVRGMLFKHAEGSFLAGVAAALKTQTNNVGFIGGVDIPLIHAFEVGFVAGVNAVNPDIEIDIKYASVPPDFSGFGDPVKGKEIALAQYEAGADVIYHAAGGTGIGMFEAAAEVSASTGSKVWGIGVDQDQYLTIGGAIPEVQEYILTSMVKKVEVAVYNAIKDTVNGTFSGGPVAEDVESGGIDISYTGGYIDDIKDEIEAYRAKIISGEIVVPSSR